MNEHVSGFLDEVLQRYFGALPGSCPPMSRADVERLLTGDAQRRLDRARLAATDWSRTEIDGDVGIVAECLLITPRGLIYAAELSGTAGRSGAAGRSEVARRGSVPVPPPRRPVYYVATPPELFEPVAERVDAARPLAAQTAAVDSRFGQDLVFTWPLDGVLQRTLDAHEVLRLGLRAAAQEGDQPVSG